eukprot:1161084-Pelagomonas_calceolata.AAC.5
MTHGTLAGVHCRMCACQTSSCATEAVGYGCRGTNDDSFMPWQMPKIGQHFPKQIQMCYMLC